jgi:TolA-binding protein
MQAVQQQGTQAPRGGTEPLRVRIRGALARSLQRFRVVFLAVVIAGAAFLVGYIVYMEVEKDRAGKAAALAEAAMAAWDDWNGQADAAKKSAQEKDLRAQLDGLITRYPRDYGAQRALFLRAELSYALKDWAAARTDWEALAARFPKSYLAPVALFDAATCAEETGDLTGSQSLYAAAAAYTDSPVAPHALFNEGRVAEAQESWAPAQKAYEQLGSVYPGSEWTTLAKNRLITLKVQGRIK